MAGRSVDEEQHNDRVIQRSLFIYVLVVVLFASELGILFYNSALVPGLNADADRYADYAVNLQNANTIVPGDVLDRNGEPIVEHNFEEVTHYYAIKEKLVKKVPDEAILKDVYCDSQGKHLVDVEGITYEVIEETKTVLFGEKGFLDKKTVGYRLERPQTIVEIDKSVYDQKEEKVLENGKKINQAIVDGEQCQVYEESAIEQVSHYRHDKAYSQCVGFLLPQNAYINEDETGMSTVNKDNSYRLLSYYYQNMYNTESLDSCKGNSIRLTLDAKIQEAAYQCLTEEIGDAAKGSVVIMDARSGAILAMVSLPAVDLSDVESARKYMDSEEAKNLEIRYPVTHKGSKVPGSIFKIVTDVSLRDNGLESFEAMDASYTCYGKQINNADSELNEMIGLRDAFCRSSNIYFSQAALSLGSKKLTETAKLFRLGEKMELDFGTVESIWGLNPAVKDEKEQSILLAETGYGQGKTTFTTLNAAMIVQTIANGGVMMKPYLVDAFLDEHGNTVAGIDNRGNEVQPQGIQEYAHVTSEKTADEVTEDMLEATAYHAGAVTEENWDILQSYSVAGKTGTGEVTVNGENVNNAWYVSFAPSKDPKYVIAVNHIECKDYGASLMNMTAELYQILFEDIS